MYHRDQPEIGAYALSSDDAMARVITFVYLTIQQSFTTVPAAMQDVDDNGVSSKFLWGFKLDAYRWLLDNKARVYDDVRSLHTAFSDPRVHSEQMLHYFASMPGLGLVKGGFCVQLMFGETGCIDSHNLEAFGVPASSVKATRYKKAKPPTRNKLVRYYLDTCEDIGGSEFMWNHWCTFIAERSIQSADEISRLHVTAIKG